MKNKKLIIIIVANIIIALILGIIIYVIFNNNKDINYWNEDQGVNVPRILRGLTPVIYEEGIQEVKNASEEMLQNNTWYNYVEQEGDTQQGGTSKWANAKSEDGSLWVWIPRFAYKIEYIDEENKSQGGNIEIVFLKGTTNNDKNNIDVTTLGYIVHPCFRDGKKNNYQNGEWDKEIPGIWVAKFEAGFAEQKGTASENIKQVNTSKTYQHNGENINGEYINSQTLLSFPVFMGKTYAYNNVEIGEMYLLGQEITSSKNPYGFLEKEIESHLMKNSEWGAVAYLAHSRYGRNGTRITANNINFTQKNELIGSVTGYAGEVVNAISNIANDEFNELQEEYNNKSYAWYTKQGMLASTTGNLYGIYDLSGGSSEYVLAFSEDISTESQTTHARVFALVEKSDKNCTIYKANYDNPTPEGNYEINDNINIHGDCTIETSDIGYGYTSWNSETSTYISSLSPFFLRGGDYTRGRYTGIFSFSNHSGHSSIEYGFRVTLIEK